MIKLWKRIVILAAVFIAGLFVFSKILYHETEDLTTEMAEATLPVVYLVEDGELVNELHGYVQEMDAASVRDTITPLEEDGVLPIQISTYGNEISAIRFEVRSLDTTRLLQESEAVNMTLSGETLTADLNIENLLTEGEEYILIIEVDTADTTSYFYTRILQGGDNNIEECIAFVKEFHEITMDKDRQSELSSYMEPDSSSDNTTLQTVTIYNSLSQACWGDFEGSELTEPIASIKEINDTYSVIVLTYILTAVDEEGNQEFYNVEEYYRVRYGTEKMYLLSFERTVEEIFQGNGTEIDGDVLILGIRSSDVDFKANESGTVVCFVQQGELWSYNLDTDTLTKVYSFRSSDDMDVRENYDEHDIRIIRANESGSIDFIVYGYMNRGDHEGEVGISVCYYDSQTNTVEEQLFIPSEDSYQMMKEEIGQLMYISDDGKFYFNMGDQIHEVDLETLEDTILFDGLTDENYVSSDDGQYLAWTEGDADDATVMHLTNFETGVTVDIEVDADSRIRPIGFLESDCVYGIASAANVSEESSIFAMNQIVIIDSESEDLEVIKTYEFTDVLVADATVEDGSIYLEQVIYSDGVYVETESETIRNRDMQEEDLVYESETTDDRKQTLVTLQLSEEVENTPNLREPKLIISTEDTTLTLAEEITGSAYYVYAKGRILLGTGEISDAVISADENYGVVIGENQTYVWKRAKSTSKSLTIETAGGTSAQAKAVAIMLYMAGYKADTDALLAEEGSVLSVLTETAVDSNVYNLTGVSVDQTLYYVSTGSPVYALLDGSPVLIVGYDDSSVTLYDPSDESTSTVTLTTAEEDFAASGNVFYVIAADE